jgi:glycosyltransferase involved in cell wall biosynthesis
MQKKVVVAIPAYNAAATLPEALQSIAQQTHRNLRVIVIDDGSTDDTPNVVAQFLKQDSRFEYHRMSSNQGASAARNLALEMAGNTDFVMFQDADDVAAPNRVEVQLRYVMEQQLAVCGARSLAFGAVPAPVLMPFESRPQHLLARLFYTSEIPTSVMMVRRSLIDGVRFDERIRNSEDADFVSRVVVQKNARVGAVPQVLQRYRRHPRQITGTIVDSPESAISLARSRLIEAAGIERSRQDLIAHVALAPSLWRVILNPAVTPQPQALAGALVARRAARCGR